MDIGMIVIQVRNGVAIVARCETDREGDRLIPASNAEQLANTAARFVVGLGGTLDKDGIYLCSDELQAAAVFAPLELPDDAIPYHAARALLYPDVSPNDAWRLAHEHQKAGRIRVYRVGVATEMRQYVSRAAIVQLAGRVEA